ncbi:ribonuclease T2-like [Borealophlyctis nickersoniae]|nr:ribonuclease T2-like [Borealophlyctis nickersoniae]
MSTLAPRCYPKHTLPDQDIVDYFRTALSLRPKYNLYKIFAQSGIIPSKTKTYSVKQLQDALVKGTGFQGSLLCTKGDDGKSYLSETWIYLTAKPNFKFQSQAPVPAPYTASCNATTVYYLPVA